MNKKLLILFSFVIVSILATVLLMQNQQKYADSLPAGKKLFPELESEIETVDKITVQLANGQLIELAKDSQQWVVASHDDYPADFNKVSALLTNLIKGKLREAKTKKPEYYAKLGVTDIENPDSKSVLLTLYINSPEKNYQLLVGNQAQGWSGQYVRKPGDSQSWLFDQEIIIQRNPIDWLAMEVINISPASIQKVTFQPPKGSRLKVTKDSHEKMNFVIENMPKNKQLAYQDAPNAVADILSHIMLENVIPADDFVFDPATSHYLIVECFNGLIIHVWIVEKEEKYYAAFSANYNPEHDAQQFSIVEDGSNTPTKVNLEQQIGQLNQGLSPWVYQIGEYVYRDFTRELEDWLKTE